MIFLLILPTLFSSLLITAHFLRFGHLAVALLCLSLPLILLFAERWAARTIQVYLSIGSLLWIATTINLAKKRIAEGDDWVRLVVILGSVSLFTLLSALLYQTRWLKRRYKL